MSITRLFDLLIMRYTSSLKEDALWPNIMEFGQKTSQRIRESRKQISRGLLKLGIKPGDKITNFTNNRTEWHIMDLGISKLVQ